MPLFPIYIDNVESILFPYAIQIQAEGISEMADETRRDWETVQEDEKLITQRLRVGGGWLYRVVSINGEVSVVFVPGASDK